MATISLKAYISRVDTLLTVGNLDEVVHHCRHILVSFPRNAEAGHMLGQALVQMGGNASEARAVLRRVLAVTPDDAATHAALGEASQRTGQFEEAIWYLERASEHATGNRAYRERLRSLYRMHREPGADLPEGLPGAVARRQIRESQRVQAIRTLQQALKVTPGRQDLRLLLARTQWDVEKRIEAAETALDVLEVLPWCLQANLVLARLWLAESRPTDVRQFLDRIHDVDPYYALRLVSSNPPDEHAFTLSELDYRQYGENNPPAQQPAAIPDPVGHRGSLGRREDEFQSDITDGSLPDWLQESVSVDSGSDELAWLEGDTTAAPHAAADKHILPWEGDVVPAPPSATQPHIPPDERGDELDWLNNPAGGGPEWSGSTVAPQTAPSRAPAGNWRVAQSGPEYQPATAGAHSRKQFVFSRLPLWLRAPSAGLPSMDRNRGRRRRSDSSTSKAPH